MQGEDAQYWQATVSIEVIPAGQDRGPHPPTDTESEAAVGTAMEAEAEAQIATEAAAAAAAKTEDSKWKLDTS